MTLFAARAHLLKELGTQLSYEEVSEFLERRRAVQLALLNFVQDFRDELLHHRLGQAVILLVLLAEVNVPHVAHLSMQPVRVDYYCCNSNKLLSVALT